jgi:Spy/CpxP family protein refolding chaperone
MRKSKWIAALLLVATFVLGALSGGAAVGLSDRGTGEWRPPRGNMVAHMTEQLDLTVEQQDSVRAILEQYRETFHTMREQIGSDIRGLLTPEQQEKYEAMTVNYRSRHGKRSGEPRGRRP